MSYTIRDVTPADVPVMLELIKELAVYEREPDAVKADEADLLRDGFGPEPLFHGMLAEYDGKVAGICLYFYKWSTWEGRGSLHLEDLFVRPDYRGHGIGLGLLQKLARLTLEKGFQRFEWEVLDWNMLARDFYHKIGAIHREGWYPYRIEGAPLKKLAGMS